MICDKKNNLITEDAFFIMNLIENSGYKARIVGGAVRDFLFGLEASDIDIATDAVPNEVIDICKKNDISFKVLGMNYGTVLILYNDKSYEISTLREDIKTFGRGAEVKFTNSFEVDSCRRDFTVNAIYMDKNGEVFDYHSGITDIELKTIRFIGVARERIEEDYLRILRYFRFVAGYGEYKINKEYIDLICSLKSNINILSSERVLAELLKIFAIHDSYKIVPMMRDILDELFDLKCNSFRVCEKLKIFSTMSNVDRLCMLLKFSKIPVNELVNKYNFSRDIREKVLLKLRNEKDVVDQLKNIKKKHRKFYAQYAIVKSCIDNIAIEPFAELLINNLLEFCDSEYIDFPLRGSDFTEYNLTKKELEQVMITTRNFWDNYMGLLSKKSCIKYAMNYIDNNIRNKVI